MLNRPSALAAAGLLLLALGGCANTVIDQLTYKGADASCISTAYRSLNNPFDDIAQVYFIRLDGRDTGGAGSWTGPPKELCVAPGEHAVEMWVVKGYASANLFFRMNYAAGARYRLDARQPEHDFALSIFQADGGKESLVMTLGSASKNATPQIPIMPMPIKK